MKAPGLRHNHSGSNRRSRRSLESNVGLVVGFHRSIAAEEVDGKARYLGMIDREPKTMENNY